MNESFLQFEHAERLDAEALTQKIIDTLERYGLEYKSNLVGQSYDGAAVMSGKHRGVQTRIKQLAKQAFYVHCNAHCLNLVLADTVKAIPEANFPCYKNYLYSCLDQWCTKSSCKFKVKCIQVLPENFYG